MSKNRKKYTPAERRSWRRGLLAGLKMCKRKKGNPKPVAKSKPPDRKPKPSPAPDREEKVIDWGDTWEAVQDMREERAAIERINHLW